MLLTLRGLIGRKPGEAHLDNHSGPILALCYECTQSESRSEACAYSPARMTNEGGN